MRLLNPAWICCLALLLGTPSAFAGEPGSSDAHASPRGAVGFAPDFGEESSFVGRREARAFGRLGLFALGREHGFDPRTSTYDIEGGATVSLIGPLSLSGGYRLLDYEFTPSESSLTYQLRGPFVSLSLDF